MCSRAVLSPIGPRVQRSRAMLVEAWNVCHRPLADLNTPIGVNAYEKSEKA